MMNSYQDIESQNVENSKNDRRNRIIGTVTLLLIGCILFIIPYHIISYLNSQPHSTIKKQPIANEFPFFNESECINQFTRNYTECESLCLSTSLRECIQYDPFTLTCVCCDFNCQPGGNQESNLNDIKPQPNPKTFPFFNESECIIEYQRNETECESLCSSFSEDGCNQFDPFTLTCACCKSGCEPFTTQTPATTSESGNEEMDGNITTTQEAFTTPDLNCGTCTRQQNAQFYYECARICEINYNTLPECIEYDSITHSCECC